MSSKDVIKPYEGPPPTADNFVEANPELPAALLTPIPGDKDGNMMAGSRRLSTNSELGPLNAGLASPPARAVRPLDPESQRNFDRKRRELRSNPPGPATIINLHPWELFYPAGDYYLRGIKVPACIPGQDYAFAHIRNSVMERRANEEGILSFDGISPIRRAGQFMKDFGESELYGGGVIIFEGERNIAKMLQEKAQVETYQPNGSPDVKIVQGFEWDDEGHKIPADVDVPVKRVLSQVIDEQWKGVERRYMIKVQWADAMYKSTRPGDRNLITDQHRLMAEVLHARGIIPVVPEWNLASKMELGLTQEVCKACGANPKEGAYMCPNGHVIHPLAAYKDAAIEYGHASMERMSADEWEEADKIKAEREKIRGKRAKAEAKKKD